MKVLITVASYLPSRDGVQFVTSYLAEGLAQRGHYVHVITKEYSEHGQDLEENINDVHITRFDIRTVHLIHKGDKQGFIKYVLANCNDYDAIINVSTQAPFTDWLLPVIDQIHIPKILHLHSIWDFKMHKADFGSVKSLASKLLGNLRWGIYFLHYKKAFQQYNAVLQLHNQDYGCKFFKKKYNIDSFILENAAEEAFFENDSMKKEKLIVNVSNYHKGKNQLDCIRVFEKSDIPEDWKLVLVGSKENGYYKKLKHYCQTELEPEKRDRVILHVGLSREQVIDLVKKSSIYLMTSLREAFPISLLEGLAAGVPFISSDVGIVKYLGGGLVAHDREDFTKKLEYLVVDEEYRNSLGEAGRNEACEKYRIGKKVDQLEEIIYSLVSKE